MTTASHSHESRQRRTSPAGSPPTAAATAPTSSRARLSRSPCLGRGRSSRASASSSSASVLAPIPGTSRSRPDAAAARELVGGAHAERARQLDRALGAQAEVAAEADEVRRQLALDLSELLDLARLHQLAQPRLDPLADPAQLADPATAHEVLDWERGTPDRLGGAAVGADRVRVRLDELEHQRERLQAIGDLGVVHEQ